jgi:tRNA pseudouridine13 synthase
MSDNEDIDARPQKRPRLDDSSLAPALAAPAATPSTSNSAPTAPIAPASTGDSDLDREIRAGINEYVSPNNLGFTGILKQRYTDFQVNEILPTGEVLHLKSIGLGRKDRSTQKVEHQKKEQQTKKQNEQNGAEAQGNGEVKEEKAQTDGDALMADVDKVKEDGKTGTNETDPGPGLKTEEEGDSKVEAGDDLSDEDVQALIDIFGEETTQSLRSLARQIKRNTERKAKDFKAIIGPVMSEKEQRTKAHQTLRRIFPNMLESSMEPDQSIRIKARPPAERGNKKRDRNSRDQAPDRQRGQLAWQERGGEYLHFTLYKENKDTMEVVGFLGSMTGGGPKSYGFAGTKDRRACTVQRVCVKRQTAHRMADVSRQLYNAALGDFEYKHHDIRLGDLAGNEFHITLRDCHFEKEEGLDFAQRLELAEKALSQTVEDLGKNGFINYYGLQRFGSFAASTDAIGIKLLQEDLQGAVEDILGYNDVSLAANDDTENKSNILISKDDRLRAKGLHAWETTQNAGDALHFLPKKFSAERNIIQHLGSRNNQTRRYDRTQDWQGALMTIPRGLRLMYVHAYQSLVWNIVAGKRWAMYGNKVVEGDLVLVHEHKDKEGGEPKQAQATVDQDGEAIINPAGEDSAFKNDDVFERARPLTKKEAEGGMYNIFDIVLPQPGFDVEYPKNAIGEYYKEFMGSERGGGLDPHNMRRKWREISLSGGYRKFLSRPLQTMSFEVKEYTMPDQQLVKTDLERVRKQMREAKDKGSHRVVEEDTVKEEKIKEEKIKEEGEAEETHMRDVPEQKIAVILKFQLGTSQYATIALRELMKAGGVKAFKPEFMGGR